MLHTNCHCILIDVVLTIKVYTLSTWERHGKSFSLQPGLLLELRTHRTSLYSLQGLTVREQSWSLLSTQVPMLLLEGTPLVPSPTSFRHHSVSLVSSSLPIQGLITRWILPFKINVMPILISGNGWLFVWDTSQCENYFIEFWKFGIEALCLHWCCSCINLCLCRSMFVPMFTHYQKLLAAH